MNMKIAKFMAGNAGRGIRIALGILLIALGLFVIGDLVGVIIAIIGVVPILAGVFNFCLLGFVLGTPFRGEDVLKAE